jgi:hypothetical protein
MFLWRFSSVYAILIWSEASKDVHLWVPFVQNSSDISLCRFIIILLKEQVKDNVLSLLILFLSISPPF